MIRAFLEKKVPGEMLSGNLLVETSGNNLSLPTHFLEPLNTVLGLTQKSQQLAHLGKRGVERISQLRRT